MSRNAEKYSDLIAQVLQINSENRFLTYFYHGLAGAYSQTFFIIIKCKESSMMYNNLFFRDPAENFLHLAQN
jgi:hypothetical protein